MEQPGFSLVLDLDKSLVFQKLTAKCDFGEWTNQPYIVRRYNQYVRSPNMYALHDDTMFTRTAYWVGRCLPQHLRQRLRKSSWYRR